MSKNRGFRDVYSPDLPFILANEDFLLASRRSFVETMGALVRRESDSLIPFDLVRKYLGEGEEHYIGLRSVPTSSIIGSEQKHRQFTPLFAPKAVISAFRWKKIDAAFRAGVQMPPVSLYEIGGAYFVRDGNHRVSVAKQTGIEYIDAEIIAIPSGTKIVPGMKESEVRRLIAEKLAAGFARSTGLKTDRRGISPSTLSGWDHLVRDIERHRLYLASIRTGTGHGPESEVEPGPSFRQAAASWYDSIYIPILRAAGRRRRVHGGGESAAADRVPCTESIAAWFSSLLPGTRDADVYLAVLAWTLAAEDRIQACFEASEAVGGYRSRGGKRSQRGKRPESM